MIQDPPAVPAPAGIDSGAWGAAIDEIRRYCNWHISPVATETVRIVAVDGDLVAPTLRLVAVESVTVRAPDRSRSTRSPCRATSLPCLYPITGTATVAITHGYVQLPRRWRTRPRPWSRHGSRRPLRRRRGPRLRSAYDQPQPVSPGRVRGPAARDNRHPRPVLDAVMPGLIPSPYTLQVRSRTETGKGP